MEQGKESSAIHLSKLSFQWESVLVILNRPYSKSLKEIPKVITGVVNLKVGNIGNFPKKQWFFNNNK